MFYKTIRSLLLFLLLAGCNGRPQVSVPTGRLALTSNLQSYWTRIVSCQQDLAITMKVDVLPLNSISQKDYSIILQVDPNSTNGMFSTKIQELKIFLIVNPANPVSSLNDQQVTSILLGLENDWQKVAPTGFLTSKQIHLYSYDIGDDVRNVIEGQVLNGQILSSAYNLVPDPVSMLQAVARDESAIGYLLDLQPVEGVKVLEVSSRMAARFTAPLLAVFPSEPSTLDRAFVRCLSDAN